MNCYKLDVCVYSDTYTLYFKRFRCVSKIFYSFFLSNKCSEHKKRLTVVCV